MGENDGPTRPVPQLCTQYRRTMIAMEMPTTASGARAAAGAASAPARRRPARCDAQHAGGGTRSAADAARPDMRLRNRGTGAHVGAHAGVDGCAPPETVVRTCRP